jgi:hypothetical protein
MLAILCARDPVSFNGTLVFTGRANLVGLNLVSSLMAMGFTDILFDKAVASSAISAPARFSRRHDPGGPFYRLSDDTDRRSRCPTDSVARRMWQDIAHRLKIALPFLNSPLPYHLASREIVHAGGR